MSILYLSYLWPVILLTVAVVVLAQRKLYNPSSSSEGGQMEEWTLRKHGANEHDFRELLNQEVKQG